MSDFLSFLNALFRWSEKESGVAQPAPQTAPQPEKYCANCKHCIQIGSKHWFSECRVCLDIISGQPDYCQAARGRFGKCGPEATLFEPKEAI